MSDHIHSWEPIPNLCARYRCVYQGCAATAWRGYDGKLREHKQKLRRPTEITRRSQRHSDGRVGRDPIDDWSNNEGDPD